MGTVLQWGFHYNGAIFMKSYSPFTNKVYFKSCFDNVSFNFSLYAREWLLGISTALCWLCSVFHLCGVVHFCGVVHLWSVPFAGHLHI